MARVLSIVALLAVALLVADACAYRTIVTTVEVDEDNQGRQERCHHIRPREQIRSCENFLRQLGGGSQWPGPAELVECCGELRNVEEQCRCDALQEVAREAQGQQQQYGQQGSHILQQARTLPSMCQLRPQRCDF